MCVCRFHSCVSDPVVFRLPPQIPGHQSVFINEPRLSDFKQVLLKEGIQAEFVGGVLVCNNMVAVRRVSFLPAWLASRPSAPRNARHHTGEAASAEDIQNRLSFWQKARVSGFIP